MSADGGTPGDPSDGDIPLEELANLGEEPPPGFTRAVYRRLNRRLLTTELVHSSSAGWSTAVLEYLGMLFEVVDSVRRTKKGS